MRSFGPVVLSASLLAASGGVPTTSKPDLGSGIE